MQSELMQSMSFDDINSRINSSLWNLAAADSTSGYYMFPDD